MQKVYNRCRSMRNLPIISNFSFLPYSTTKLQHLSSLHHHSTPVPSYSALFALTAHLAQHQHLPSLASVWISLGVVPCSEMPGRSECSPLSALQVLSRTGRFCRYRAELSTFLGVRLHEDIDAFISIIRSESVFHSKCRQELRDLASMRVAQNYILCKAEEMIYIFLLLCTEMKNLLGLFASWLSVHELTVV